MWTHVRMTVALLALAVIWAGCDTTVYEVLTVASVDISGVPAEIAVGEDALLSARALSGEGALLSGRDFTWSTSDPDVATVTDEGRLTAVAPGDVTVSATTEGVSGSAATTVISLVVSVDVYPPSGHQMGTGWSRPYTATARDGAGGVVSGLPVAWSSSNPAVASVSDEGTVRGESGGSAQIRATVAGVTGNATITISSDPCAAVTLWPTVAAVQGALYARDCVWRDDGFPSQFFGLTSTDQFSVETTLTGTAFQLLSGWYLANSAWLPTSYEVGLIDGGDGELMTRVLVPAGRYLHEVHSYDGGEGDYELRVEYGPSNPEVTNCEMWILVPDIDYRGSLAASDCEADQHHADIFTLPLDEQETVTIDYSSSEIDALMGLHDVDFNLLVGDDDSGGGTDARIEYTAPSRGLYRLLLTSYDPGGTGSYRLEIRSTGAAADGERTYLRSGDPADRELGMVDGPVGERLRRSALFQRR